MNFHTTSRLAANHKENVRLHLPLVATLLVIINGRCLRYAFRKPKKKTKNIAALNVFALVDD